MYLLGPALYKIGGKGILSHRLLLLPMQWGKPPLHEALFAKSNKVLKKYYTGCGICFGPLLNSLRLEKRPKTYAAPCRITFSKYFFLEANLRTTFILCNLKLPYPSYLSPTLK